MANQILLYSETPVQRGPHFIRLVNSSFENSVDVSGDWQSPSQEWSWLASGGFASYGDNTYHGSLIQTFVNAPLEGTFYDVTVNISNLTVGGVEVWMGQDQIATLTSDGTHTILYGTSSGLTLAGQISFVPLETSGNYFDGRINSVSIVQNANHVAPPSTFTYEPTDHLDMYGDEPIGLNFKLGDATALNKKFGSFSKEFAIPNTPNNARVLGHLHTLEAKPKLYDPARKIKAALLVDSLVVSSGYMQIKEVTNDGNNAQYTVAIYDESFGLLDAVKGKKLLELDLSSWSHRLTLDNVRAGWSASTWDHKWSYELMPVYGVQHNISSHFRPSFYHRAILEEIASQAGFTIELSPDIAQWSNQLLHTPLGKRPAAATDDLLREKARATSNTSQVITSSLAANAMEQSIDWQYVRSPWTANVEVEDPSGNYDPTLALYVAPYDGQYTVELNVLADMVIDTSLYSVEYFGARTEYPHIKFSLADVDTGQILASTDQRQFPSELFGAFSESRMFSFSATSVNLVAGQRVRVMALIDNTVVYKTQSGPTVFIRPSVSVAVDDSQSFVSIVPTPGTYPVQEGMTVRAEDWLGNSTQEAFLNDMLRAWNAYVLPGENGNEKAIRIVSHSHLYGDPHIIVRTEQVDMASEITHERLSSISSAKLRLAYKEPKDSYNERYTTITRKEYGSKEFSYRTNLFGGDESLIRLNLYTPSPIIRDDAGRLVSGLLLNADEATNKLLLKATASTPTTLTVAYYDELTQQPSTFTFDHYYQALHTDGIGSGSTFDLNFGEVSHALTNTSLGISSNNLFALNYQQQQQMIRDGYLVEVAMRLSHQDVQEHRKHLGSRIYIKELGWFVLHHISDWDPQQADNQLTKVLLMETTPSAHVAPTNYTRFTRTATATNNPVSDGAIGGNVLVESGSQPPTNVFNNNTGYNSVGGTYNTVRGSGNTVAGGTRFVNVYGDDNRIDAGVNNTTVFGSGVSATTSNSFYFGNNLTITPSGSTYYGASGVTIGPTSSNFYGTIITSSGVSINGVVLETTHVQNGINTYTGGTPSRPTVNVSASPVFSAITASTFFCGTTNISAFMTGGTSLPAGTAGHLLFWTGGSWTSRNMGLLTSPNATDWVRLGDPSNAVNGTSLWCGVFGGFNNTINGNTVIGAIVGGGLSQIHQSISNTNAAIVGAMSARIYSGSSAVIVGGEGSIISAGTWSTMIGGDTNRMTFSSRSVVAGGRLNHILSGASSVILGGLSNTISGATNSVILAGENIVGTASNTLYATNISIQNVLDLVALTGTTPTYRTGRIYLSGDTLYLGTGGTYREIALV